uniref:Uncharacterized protein n=1 Tax=Arundo donax TaxID=35708 RepID=A0A0A9E8K5_ARUDO
MAGGCFKGSGLRPASGNSRMSVESKWGHIRADSSCYYRASKWYRTC